MNNPEIQTKYIDLNVSNKRLSSGFNENTSKNTSSKLFTKLVNNNGKPF